MQKRTKKIVLTLVLAVILVAAFAELAEAARWKYHARRSGWIVVWGTRHCRIVTRPLRIQRVYRCNVYRGWLPWYCNDWMVWHYWWPPGCCRPRITRTKYYVPPCPYSCWWRRWRLFPIYEWLEDYMPNYYGVEQLTVPSFGLGDMPEHRDIYVMINMGAYLEGGGPAAMVSIAQDANDPVYFSNGKNPSLPGITVAEGEDPFEFDPNADPNDDPVKIKDANDLYTGDLYLQDDQTFDNEEYNGSLVGGDNNYDGTVNLRDFAGFCQVYLKDVNTVPDPCEWIPDPCSFDYEEPNGPEP